MNKGIMNKFENKEDEVVYAKVDKTEKIAILDLNCNSAGPDHLVFVYLTPDEKNIMRLWCNVDNTYQCAHTKFAWTLPDVQERVQNKFVKLNKGGKINERRTA